MSRVFFLPATVIVAGIVLVFKYANINLGALIAGTGVILFLYLLLVITEQKNNRQN